MYTESFAGDVDGILAAMAIARPTPAPVKTTQTAFYVYAHNRERLNQYGMSKSQRERIGIVLFDAVRSGFAAFPECGLTFHLDDNRRIVVHGVDQCINLYHKMTGQSFFGGKRKGKKSL